MIDFWRRFMIYYTRSFGKAGVAQWQSSSLPSWLRGFDSLRPLQGQTCQSGVMAAAADSKSAVRKYVRVRVPPLAPTAGRTNHDWRGVRVVDGATLERLCGRKSTGGSNPPPSASQFSLILLSETDFGLLKNCEDSVGGWICGTPTGVAYGRVKQREVSFGDGNCWEHDSHG